MGEQKSCIKSLLLHTLPFMHVLVFLALWPYFEKWSSPAILLSDACDYNVIYTGRESHF